MQVLNFVMCSISLKSILTKSRKIGLTAVTSAVTSAVTIAKKSLVESIAYKKVDSLGVCLDMLRACKPVRSVARA